jgi:aminoglycoside phosphotransferase (APT) family kinase protein
VVVVTRSANFLAALASAALPGLDPVGVQAVRCRPGDPFEIAFVEDSEERRWVIQAPRTPVAGAMLEDITDLSMLLGRRLDIAVPMVKGQVVVPEGRAVVYARLPGRPLDFAAIPAGLGLAADLGRALAHVHNLEVELFEEAGRPTYDAATTRARLLSDLDRAAATGHVPTALLSRWEPALEDVSLWRFLPTPVHGNLVGANVLASFDDEADADSGRIRAVTGWEESHVGDPADDFADLAALTAPGVLESVLQAYAPSRIDRPDSHLLERARLSAELRLTRRLLRALAAEERELVDQAAADLRALEERVYAEEVHRPHEQTRPRPRRPLLNETSATGHVERAEDVAPVVPVEVSEPRTTLEPVAPVDPEAPVDSEAPVELAQPMEPSPRRGPRVAPAHLDTVAVPQRPGTRAAPEGDSWVGSASQQTVDATPAQVAAPTEDVREPDRDGADRDADTGTAEAAGATRGAPALHFEIDEAEPLSPEPSPASARRVAVEDDAAGADPDDGGVLDLHEGASEFVPVERRHHPPESSVGS